MNEKAGEKAGENAGVVAGGGNCFVVFRLCFYVAVFAHEWDRCGVSIGSGCFGCGGAFSWIGLVKAIAMIFFFFLPPPLSLFFMVELLVLQGKGEVVSWVTLLCFVGALCLQLNAFALAWAGRGFWAFFSGLLVTALVWGRLRVVRANAARVGAGAA
ncbi:MAG: hypothetical protein ACTTJV_02980 [Ottowia sp.]